MSDKEIIHHEYDPALGGEIRLDLDFLERFEYDIDDAGDGRIVIQYWDNNLEEL